MGEYINFEVEDAEVIDESPDSQFAIAKIRAFSSGPNRHNYFCSPEILKETADSIYNKPILYTIDKTMDDFYTHVDPDKSLIAGFVVPNSAEFKKEENGVISLNVLARVWKRYAPKVIELFQRDKKKKISVEMELYKTTAEDSDGLRGMLSFAYTGICILSDFIREASPGASMSFVNFAEENAKYKEAVEKEFSSNLIDLSVPRNVLFNIEEGIKLNKTFNRGSTSVELATAKSLLKEKPTLDKVKQILQCFEVLHKSKNIIKEEIPSNDYISWQLYGGNEGYEWVKKISKESDEMEKENFEFITFPYKDREDMNPALKGIDPPITAEQGTEIAKQADAIGSDDKKNGWAIAIANFKKTHVVKDGRWVKKESNSEEKNMAEEEKDKKEEPEKKDEKEIEKEKEEKEEKPKEESKDKPEDKPKEEKMSNEENLDFKAILAMLAGETEAYEKVAEEEFAKPFGERNFAKVCGAMYSKFCKMTEKFSKLEADNKAYMAENEELKKYKADKEGEKKEFEIESMFAELKQSVEIPETDINEMREKAKEFSLENIEGWKNYCKAKAFSFAIKSDKKDDGVKRYPLPFPGKPEKNNSPWSRK